MTSQTVTNASDAPNVLAPCVAHAGDGNLHYTLVNRDDEAAVEWAMP